MAAEVLRRVADDPALMEVGRMSVEAALVERREARMSEFGRGNGLVIREASGQPSDTIRFGPETAVQIALRAIADKLDAARMLGTSSEDNHD